MRARRRCALGRTFGRFLASGAFNTAATYLLYLGLLQLLPYRVSYTVSYAAGIVIAYELNRIFVFRAARSLRSALLTPAIYAIQYLLGLGLLWIIVSRLGIDARLGPLVVIAVSTPLTFVLSRVAFSHRDDR